MMSIEQIQEALNLSGVNTTPLKVDGRMGPMTRESIKRFQRRSGLLADGIAGAKTKAFLAKIVGEGIERDADPARSPASSKEAKSWPRQKDVNDVFGRPCSSQATAGTVRLPVAMRLAWNLNTEIKTFKCHELVADAMTEIFSETVEHYGEDEWRRLRLDLFGGCYNCRAMRGGTRYSMHAYGIAVDIDPERNQLRWDSKRASLAGDEYEPFWKIIESKGAVSLGRTSNFDWMHFQFARL